MLDAYLTGSVGQLMERARHLQASISRQLAVPKNLPPEFHTLAQTCRNEVNNLMFDLGSLLSDSRFQRADLQAIRLRAYKRIVEELDFLELVGVAALIRVNEEDRSMTKVVGVIAEEIKYPLIPPVVSCQSQGYFQAFPGLNLLSIPQKEVYFLLHLPDLYHELAHFLLTEKNNPAVEPFQEALRRSIMAGRGHVADLLSNEGRGTKGFVNKLRAWDANWVCGWGIELCCDLFAVLACGPAFAWSHLHLCAKRAGDPFLVDNAPDSTHPSDAARMFVMLEALGNLEYSVEALAIEEKWNQLLAQAGYAENADYTICFPHALLARVASYAFVGYQSIGCAPSSKWSGAKTHDLFNEAWQRFWSDPKLYAEWEKTNRVTASVPPGL